VYPQAYPQAYLPVDPIQGNQAPPETHPSLEALTAAAVGGFGSFAAAAVAVAAAAVAEEVIASAGFAACRPLG